MDPRLSDWLVRTSEELSRESVPPRQRPWKALEQWSLFTKRSIPLNAPEARVIFEWFRQQSRAGTHEIGQMYGGVVFYDEEVWPLSVTIMWGTFKQDMMQAIRGMPSPMMQALGRDPTSLARANAVWADCIDYGFGIDDLDKSQSLVGNARELLFSGDDKLRATVDLILRKPPSQEVTLTARLATEMFLKAYVAARKGLSEAEAKKLRHHLDKALAVCLEIAPQSELGVLSPHLATFPPMEDRYKSSDRSLRDLWTAYAIAQSAGATVVRELSGRDCRGGLRAS